MESKATELTIGWQSEQSLSRSLCTLFEKELWTDVSFTFKTEEEVLEIKSHKLILAARSPVFQAMFFGQMDNNREVEIVDASPELFELFLRCLYTDNVDLDEDSLTQVIELAHKYQVSHLLAQCAENLAKLICVKNSCQILNLAVFYDLTKLKEKACDFIDGYGDEILESAGFMDIPVETLKVILSGDTFYTDEMKIFRKCLEWAENKCKQQCLEPNDVNKRRVLGDAFYFLRLPSLSLSDFTEYGAKTNLLSQDESFKIYLHMGSPLSQADVGNSIIPRKPRSVVFPFASNQNQITIQCPHDIYLVSIILHPWEDIFQQCGQKGFCWPETGDPKKNLYRVEFIGQILIKEFNLTVPFHTIACRKSQNTISLKEMVFLPTVKGPYNVTVEMTCLTTQNAAYLENFRKLYTYPFSNYKTIIKALGCARVSNRYLQFFSKCVDNEEEKCTVLNTMKTGTSNCCNPLVPGTSAWETNPDIYS